MANVIVAEGKTKILRETHANLDPVCGPHVSCMGFKNDTTAGNGKRHALVPDKGMHSAMTTAVVMELLHECGIPVAFLQRGAGRSFDYNYVLKTAMLLWEVVVRRRSKGSMPKRLPHFKDGHYFDDLVCEFYLKTDGKVWTSHRKTYELPCDDPLAQFSQSRDGSHPMVELYKPDVPFVPGTFFLTIPADEAFTRPGEANLIPVMERLAKDAFLILEHAFSEVGIALDDFKLEFGIGPDGRLYLSDDLNGDSWRARQGNYKLSKEPFRKGESVTKTSRRYRKIYYAVRDIREGIIHTRIWWMERGNYR